MEEIKTTCLHDYHVKLGALMSPFAGYDMPIQYAGIVEEHNAVRNACGVFDVSHMGEVSVKGPDAGKFVNYIFTNDVIPAEAGKCLYGMMLHPTGGVVDDLIVYKNGDEDYFLVINAANIDKDVKWIKSNTTGFNVKVKDLSEQYGELAIQGPQAEAKIKEILGIDGSVLGFYEFKNFDYEGSKIMLSRTGYTGEDGFEIYASPEKIVEIWDKLMKGGVAPCGLGCRDTLRFEVGLPLYGDELTDDVTPLEATLSMFVKLDKPEMIGKDALVKQKAEGVKRKLVGLELADKAIPRHGYNVLNDEGEVIGQVTTGYRGISVDKSIAVALIDAKYATLGTPLQIQIRKKTFPCTVVKKRFYTPNYKK